ncbi:MAG TPA: glycosyltransferase family 4 protein [Methylomirabilota bacterium]|jgi:glycosyltransferase involved in cell wall biosynthesis|nr:glycosyltransferase family 4 protein [Methylomirabilota bacterium]
MRIAQVAPLYEPVPPVQYGGTERVVSYLTEELVRRGHAVTLFASGDSQTSAELVASAPKALRLDPDARDPLAPHILQLAQVFERAREFDLIHCHVDYVAFPYARLVGTPTLHTLHGRLDLPHLGPVFRHFRDVPLVSISDAQREPLRPLGLDWVGTVPHGLPLERYPYSPRGGEYLAFLGRLSPEKRPDLAIEVARRVGRPLKLAAKVDPADRSYFEREIEPRLDPPRIEWVGEIGDSAKARFLGNAHALLFPVDWPEPFGLVMIEALACGTPVIARPCGAVPEVIVPGIGFLGDSVEDLVEAVKRLDTIDRAACRRHVEAQFTVPHMVDRYETIYRSLAISDRAA